MFDQTFLAVLFFLEDEQLMEQFFPISKVFLISKTPTAQIKHIENAETISAPATAHS